MDSSTTASPHHHHWELRNDDGFVYKLKKRRIDPSASHPPPSTDAGEAAAAEKDAELRRRERKKRTLLKLKVKYESEILHWDNLSNTLCAMQDRAVQIQQEREVTPSLASSSEVAKDVDSVGGSLLDELLTQKQYAIKKKNNLSNHCLIFQSGLRRMSS
ncbi:PREDICTED: uncharacterized protein LOC109344390 isoform X2 [Lupinus angustifolius]|uniref:uncharacterized protein LOC109344390 isoform X2 n=1 Tax=Lupinus angustifolius TaxID=3871 RepID=UPI00092F338F|nr:PREDICTED: uncharacterized protein LOC109344390 isoform X2 [Lupinus angustifolius]